MLRMSLAIGCVWLGALLAGCGDSGDASEPPALGVGAVVMLERVFPALTFTQPVLFLQGPDDHWYVVEKAGRILRIDPVTGTAAVFADLIDHVDARDEGGLLGMAFHPDFASNGFVFLSYTTSDDPVDDDGAGFRSIVSRFNVSPDGTQMVEASETNVRTVAQPFGNHNGGYIAFGADGYLYIGLGDGGGGGDPQDNAQNVNSRLGKILRIDVEDDEFDPPAGNPFPFGGAAGDVYALGFRNPWRWSFDRLTGELWVGDVGQGDWEEVDKVVLGGNYGWNIREGSHCFPSGTTCSTAGLIDPIAEYAHAGGRCSITGGYVYRGTAIPTFMGRYLFADFCSGEIFTIPSNSVSATPSRVLDTAEQISSFAEDEDGELYVLGYASGHIFRIVPRP